MFVNYSPVLQCRRILRRIQGFHLFKTKIALLSKSCKLSLPKAQLQVSLTVDAKYVFDTTLAPILKNKFRLFSIFCFTIHVTNLTDKEFVVTKA